MYMVINVFNMIIAFNKDCFLKRLRFFSSVNCMCLFVWSLDLKERKVQEN